MLHERSVLASDYADVPLHLYTDGEPTAAGSIPTSIGIAATAPAQFPNPEITVRGAIDCSRGALETSEPHASTVRQRICG